MKEITGILIKWYSQNKRELPWRETKNPYKIWVSEVVLQQTRVSQGISYYYKFIDKYPDVFELANTKIDDLMKVWQGLGYYSRARNMLFTAKDIVDKYGGNFPGDYNELLSLRGIGDYTASAIASFAFNKVVPVLDGNVFRVLSRLFGIFETNQTKRGRNVFYSKLDLLIHKERPDLFNQAIMEFGALQCTPKKPDCMNCVFKTICFAYTNYKIEELPVKKKKVKQKERFFNYMYICNNKNAFIEKRERNDIWKLLYQLPLIETKEDVKIEELIQSKEWIKIFKNISYSLNINFYTKIHLLSHQKIITKIYKVDISEINPFIKNNYIKISINNLKKYGFPKLLTEYFEIINK